MKYPLASQGVFKTIQGEGALLGQVMTFIRLAGCSIGCPECDTDYKVFSRLETNEIVQQVINTSKIADWVWLTGGEPTDHDLSELVYWLRKCGYLVAIATAGVKQLEETNYSWISVSPHNLDFVQRRGHEIKLCIGLNGLKLSDIENIGDLDFTYKYLQPVWYHPTNSEDNQILQDCIDYCKNNSNWKLSIQAHKYWNIS